MRNWFEKLGLKLEGWMIGRYGQDELNRFLTIISLILIFMSVMLPELVWLAMLPIGLSMYRCYSKNGAKRRAEREQYLRLTEKPRQWKNLQSRKWHDRKTHRYFVCKNCKTAFRVPKGKGRIEVICPKCGDKKIRKS